MKKYLFPLFVALASLPVMGQQDKKPNVLDLKSSITDKAIVYPESFETDTQKLLEGWFMKNYTATDNRYATEADANVTDSEITSRLKALPTVVEMPFNQIVRSYIDKYTRDGRAQIAAILGLSLYYMPIFEQALEEQGLPLELKYLPVIESSLDPNAVSKHGATGLWQFMVGTAKGLGLEVNSLVDERRDPYASSERAAAYLKDLYATYGDWSLAIAAYNCGPGAINKAIRRAGGEAKSHDFWSIYEYLTPETRGYVPMFIAANYVMNYYPKHNISPVLPVKPLVTDTIHISERIHFDQISNVLDIPVEELRILNPQFREDIIPGTPENPYTLTLPSQQVHAYILSENDIRNYEPSKYSQRETVEPGDLASDNLAAADPTQISAKEEADEEADIALAASHGKKSVVVHKVVAGETLASIAEKYNVTPEDIKKNNNLRRNAVRVGQQLKVSTPVENAPAGSDDLLADDSPAIETPVTSKSVQTAQKTKTASGTTTTPAKASASSHKVKSGETLSTIAKKYGVTVAAIKSANGMTSDKLSAGKTIKIPSKGTSTAKKTTSTKKKSNRR